MIKGFDDFDEWDLDDADDKDQNNISGKSFDNKFSNSTASPDKSPAKWEPPQPSGKLTNQKKVEPFESNA